RISGIEFMPACSHTRQMRQWTSHLRFPSVRIQYREATTGRKPQPAILASHAAARHRIGRSTLCAAQPILHTGGLRSQPRPRSIRELPKLLLGPTADASRRTEPERFAIIEYLGDVVAQQPVARRIFHDAVAAQRVEAAAKRGDPQRPI